MQRPSAFKLLDAVTFGLLAVLVTGLAGYVQTTPQRTQAYALTWVVALSFWAVYGLVIRARAKYIARFPIMLSNGIMVDPGAYLTSIKTLESELERTLKLYDPHFPKATTLLTETRVWVTFKPGPFPHPQFPKAKIAGFITMGGQTAWIAYKATTQSIESTALAHELGHVIMGRAWKDWTQGKHHTFMENHGLP